MKTQEEINAMKSFPIMFSEMWKRKAQFLAYAELEHKDGVYTVEDMDKAFNKGVQVICSLLADVTMAELDLAAEEPETAEGTYDGSVYDPEACEI